MKKDIMIMEIEQYCRDNGISKYDSEINVWKGRLETHTKWVLQDILDKIAERKKKQSKGIEA